MPCVLRTITQHEITDFCWVPENLDTRKLVLGPTNFSLIFSLIFLEQNPLEPARILDFLTPDSICKYQNRQTNLLNCKDLTRVKWTPFNLSNPIHPNLHMILAYAEPCP